MTGGTAKTLTELVAARRATPSFSAAPVRDEDLKAVLRAGLEAPSGYNLQPWRFVVVRDPERRARLRGAAMNQEKVERAAVVIVACGDTQGWREDVETMIGLGRERGLFDEAQAERRRKSVGRSLGAHPNIAMWVAKQTMIAATTMMWMAESLGYDTAPMEGFDAGQVRAVLEIPDHVLPIFLLAIGRLQGADGRYAGRLPASRTVFAERYGQSLDMGDPER